MQALKELLKRNDKPEEPIENELVTLNSPSVTPQVVAPVVPIVLPQLEKTNVDARLISHVETRKVARTELAEFSVPEATATFQPVPHSTLIDALEEALHFRHIAIVRDEYAVSPDGMRMFGLLELNAEFEGVRFAIGLRNSNDKSMRLGMVAGFRCFVCDNMAFEGDFKPLLAKHTKNFELIESVSLGVDRIQRGFEPLRSSIRAMREHWLEEDDARLIIYRAFMEQRFPMKLMKRVHRDFFVSPTHEEFRETTMWSLLNTFTGAFKELKPIRQYEATAKLGKYLRTLASMN